MNNNNMTQVTQPKLNQSKIPINVNANSQKPLNDQSQLNRSNQVNFNFF